MKSITKNSSHSTSHIGYHEKYISEAVSKKFLGLQIDNHINWKNHTEEMIPKLRRACYAIWSMVQISNINTINSIYYVYIHSITKYWKFFLGNSYNNGNIFTSQKKIIRIQAGAQLRTSWRSLFKQLEILPVPCQYILSWMNLIINKQVIFQIHSSGQCINIRNMHHLHRSYANQSYFKKSTSMLA